jgi:hypothetical protein
LGHRTKSEPRKFFNKRKVDSSKEISRLILYIAFGILAACFTIFKNSPKCLLIGATIFSALSVFIHFIQYLSLYYVSKKFIDSDKHSIPNKPFKLSDVLFILKIFCTFLAAIYFIIIAVTHLQS